MKVFTLTIAVIVLSLTGIPSFGQTDGPAVKKTRGSKHAETVQGSGVVITAPIAHRPMGTIFDAHFTISNVAGLSIISYQMDVHYNSSIIQFNSCLISGTISSSGQITCNGTVPGVVELVWTNTSPLANDGDGPPSNLFKLNFTAIGTDGQVSPLTFSDVQVMEFAVPASTTSGSITIGSPTAADTMVTGRVLTQTGHPISRARVYLTDEQGILRTTLSNPFGYYRFFDVPAGGTYVIGATSKRFTFTPQVLPVGEEVVNFTLTSDQ
ncbi:MAG: carboxypeptidase regulatory-like domain-containing protein [Pyrinomonadaceae bacterium]